MNETNTIRIASLLLLLLLLLFLFFFTILVLFFFLVFEFFFHSVCGWIVFQWNGKFIFKTKNFLFYCHIKECLPSIPSSPFLDDKILEKYLQQTRDFQIGSMFFLVKKFKVEKFFLLPFFLYTNFLFHNVHSQNLCFFRFLLYFSVPQRKFTSGFSSLSLSPKELPHLNLF